MTDTPPQPSHAAMGAGWGSELLRTRWLALIALVVGPLYVGWSIGWTPLDPFDLSWFANDPAQAFLGWAFLRAEPGLHFPLTWISRYGYPVGVPAAHMDVIPVLALPLKLLANWLPKDFQYFGLAEAAGGALQAFFGFLLARRLSQGQPLATLAGGLLFLLAPVMLIRLHGHFALAAQWQLLAALLLALDATAAEGGRRRFWLAMLLLWVAGGIHPYLAAMTAPLLFAGLVCALLGGRLRWPLALLIFCAGATVLLASFLAHGFLVPGQEDTMGAWGFGIYSTNLLSFFAHTLPSTFLPGLPYPDERQNGGSGYLGFGVLVLLAATLPGLWRALRRVAARRWAPFAAIALLAFLFALSNRVALGPWMVLELPLPGWVERIAGIFRASGRFVWIAHYLLLVAMIWVVARWRWRQAAALLLPLVVVLQVIDLAPLRQHVRWANSIGWSPPPMTSPLWGGLGVRHQHLVVLPAWQCGADASPGGGSGYWTFGEVAWREHLTINSIIGPRHSSELRRTHCDELPARFQREGPEAASAYVLSDAFARVLALLPLPTHLCGRADDFVVCRLVEGRRGLTPELRQGLIAQLPLGQAVPLTAEAPYVVPRLADPDGFMALAFRTPDAAGAALSLALSCPTPLPDGALQLVLNGEAQAPMPSLAGMETLALTLGSLPADTLVGLRLPGDGLGYAAAPCQLTLSTAQP